MADIEQFQINSKTSAMLNNREGAGCISDL